MGPPVESQQLTAPQAGGEVNIVQIEHPAALCFFEECVKAVQRKNFHFLLLQLRESADFGGIHGDDPLLHHTVAGGGDHLIDIANRFDAEALGFAASSNTVYPAGFQQVLVEFLQVHGSQLLQRDISNCWFDVVLDKSPIGFVG